MNNFNKIYTAETLKSNRIVTIVTPPMEESIMVPVAQAIDLMKQSENVLYFSFNHDSVKINNFLQQALKNEKNPDKITGSIGIFDSHQIPKGQYCAKFIEETIISLMKEMSINYIIMDVIPFVDENVAVLMSEKFAFMHNITTILIKTAKLPKLAESQDLGQAEKIVNELMDRNTLEETLERSIKITTNSDFIIGVRRENKTFWKKLLNFLLFWRRESNFTLKVLKNRNGPSGQSYRMNIDMDEFKTEIL